ncbi:MAG: hypothetical protein Q8N77_04160 [Nanoarchaeota archaeon]|nr:hypothetical protein [Nanoarchaeota archaeon]
MKKTVFLLTLLVMIAGCEKPEAILNQGDFETEEPRWDAELEFDCEKCDKPVCKWEMAYELKYSFNPRNGREEAVCWYYINGKVKVRPIFEKNKITVGTNKISDPNILLDCRKDHIVGLCCAYTIEELLKDKYVCKDVLLKALCPKEE